MSYEVQNIQLIHLKYIVQWIQYFTSPLSQNISLPQKDTLNSLASKRNRVPIFPSPKGTIHLFSVFVGLPNMNISYKWNHKTCCFSCSIMFARFIHVVACTRAPFLFYGYIITHCMYKHHLLLVYSSADKHLDCFHLWAIRNNAARNKTLCKFLCGHMFSFFLGTHPGAKLLGHMVTLCVNA